MENQEPTRDGRVARRDQTQARLLAATAELFASQGYEGTSIDEIAELAGVSKGSVFYNFGSKADLFSGALSFCADQLYDTYLEAKGSARGVQALDRITQRLLESVDQYRTLALVLLSELFRDGRPWASSMPDLRSRFLAPVVQALQEFDEDRAAEGRYVVPTTLEAYESVAIMLVGGITIAALDTAAPPSDQRMRAMRRSIMVALQSYNEVADDDVP